MSTAMAVFITRGILSSNSDSSESIKMKQKKLFFKVICIRRTGLLRPVLLTQHALSVPGVGVPGADSVLHQRGDVVVHHVFHGVVHGASEVGLSCCGCTNDISHLRRDDVESKNNQLG